MNGRKVTFSGKSKRRRGYFKVGPGLLGSKGRGSAIRYPIPSSGMNRIDAQIEREATWETYR